MYLYVDRYWGAEFRQLLKDRHPCSAPPCAGWIGSRTHRSDAVGVGAWQETSAGMRQEHTALEGNAQDFDFRFEGLPRQAQLGPVTG
jgi:hypothetical protein